jgi:hypothetical protein
MAKPGMFITNHNKHVSSLKYLREVDAWGRVAGKFWTFLGVHEMHQTQMLGMLSPFSMILQLFAKQQHFLALFCTSSTAQQHPVTVDCISMPTSFC